MQHNNTAKDIVKKMKTTIKSWSEESLLKGTKVMRIIRYFPRQSNQCSKKILFYNEFGNVLNSCEATYVSKGELEDLLPKRITIIEDYCFMDKKKDFEYWDSELI